MSVSSCARSECRTASPCQSTPSRTRCSRRVRNAVRRPPDKARFGHSNEQSRQLVSRGTIQSRGQVTCPSGRYESTITPHDPPLLDRIQRRPHTAFTYHRTWEIGLEEVTRVSSSSPSFLESTPI